jgi:hypothetical protein
MRSLHRRDFFRLGTIGLTTLALQPTAQAARPRRRGQACILLYVDGGPSHVDLWVVGRTDRHAAQVTDSPVSPADLTATVFHLLGVDPGATLTDGQGRPYRLSDGTPIRALVG